MTKLEEKLKELEYIKEPNLKKTNIEYYSKNFNNDMKFIVKIRNERVVNWDCYIINNKISEHSLSFSKMVFEQEIKELRGLKND